MKRIRKRQCQCCKDFFFPDYRNLNRQHFCGKPECRQASKSASQKRWLKKNPDYFKGDAWGDAFEILDLLGSERRQDG